MATGINSIPDVGYRMHLNSIPEIAIIRLGVIAAGGVTYLATESGQFLTTEDGQKIIIE